MPLEFSSNTGTQPWAPIHRPPKVIPNPLTSKNSLLDTSLHSREKNSSPTHQNTHTSFPNQETLTSHPSNPTHSEDLHNKEEPQTARIWKGHPKHSNLKQAEKAEKYSTVKDQDKCPTNQTIGRDRKSTWKRNQNNYSENDLKSWKQNRVTNKYPGDKDWEDARNV